MVLVAHFGPGTRAFDIGKQGVGIFFVLSGYLITTNLLRERSKSGAINLKNFYLRRFFRLMPVAWTLLAITLIFGATDGREIASCVFFYRNFLIHPRTLVTSHFWSLSIEEQFYLAWPCVLVLAPRRARLFAILAASALAVYRFSLPLSFLNAHFGWTQFHADALLIGCAFALTPKIPRMPAVVFWISAIVVAVCTHFFPSFPPFGESVLIGWMIQTTARGAIPAVQKALNWRPVAQIGVMSYSLYVWQTPFTGARHNTPLTLLLDLAALGVATKVSFHWIEEPGRRLGHALAARFAKTSFLENRSVNTEAMIS